HVYVGRSTWSVPSSGSGSELDGVWDVALATDTDTPYVAVMRDIDHHAPTTVAVEVADFHPMFESALDITPPPVGGFSSSDVRLGNVTWVQLASAQGTSKYLVPPELLRDGDVQTHRFQTTLSGAGQWAEVDRGPGRTEESVAVPLAGELTS